MQVRKYASRGDTHHPKFFAYLPFHSSLNHNFSQEAFAVCALEDGLDWDKPNPVNGETAFLCG
jgi:hypothetical protein